MAMTEEYKELKNQAEEIFAEFEQLPPDTLEQDVRNGYRNYVDTYDKALFFQFSIDSTEDLEMFAEEGIECIENLVKAHKKYPHYFPGQPGFAVQIYKCADSYVYELSKDHGYTPLCRNTEKLRTIDELRAIQKWCLRIKSRENETNEHTSQNNQSQKADMPQKKLHLCILQAYQSYTHAAERMEGELSDNAAYGWLKDYGFDEYVLPAFETWARYVRKGRKHFGTQKNSPRAGRARGSSFIEASQIDTLAEITSQSNSETD